MFLLVCHLLTLVTRLQVCLGITTLLLYVPVPVAALHQSGALATLSVAMWTAHDMKFMKIISKIPK